MSHATRRRAQRRERFRRGHSWIIRTNAFEIPVRWCIVCSMCGRRAPQAHRAYAEAREFMDRYHPNENAHASPYSMGVRRYSPCWGQ